MHYIIQKQLEIVQKSLEKLSELLQEFWLFGLFLAVLSLLFPNYANTIFYYFCAFFVILGLLIILFLAAIFFI